MTNHVEASQKVIRAYREMKAEAEAKIAEMEAEIKAIRASVIKPDLTPFIQDSLSALRKYKDAARTKLCEIVMSQEFQQKHQLNAALAVQRLTGRTTVDSALDVRGADAYIAMMAAGVTDAFYLEQLFGTAHAIFDENRIGDFRKVCDRLGILDKELDDIELEIATLNGLRAFSLQS